MKLDPSAFVADSDLIQELEPYSSPIYCGKDRVLFRQGDRPAGLYILNKGEATLVTSAPQSGEATFTQASPGSVFGLSGLIFNESATLTVIARKGAQITFVSRANFYHLVQTSPRLSLLQVLANEVRILSQKLLHANADLSAVAAVL